MIAEFLTHLSTLDRTALFFAAFLVGLVTGAVIMYLVPEGNSYRGDTDG